MPASTRRITRSTTKTTSEAAQALKKCKGPSAKTEEQPKKRASRAAAKPTSRRRKSATELSPQQERPSRETELARENEKLKDQKSILQRALDDMANRVIEETRKKEEYKLLIRDLKQKRIECDAIGRETYEWAVRLSEKRKRELAAMKRELEERTEELEYKTTELEEREAELEEQTEELEERTEELEERTGELADAEHNCGIWQRVAEEMDQEREFAILQRNQAYKEEKRAIREKNRLDLILQKIDFQGGTNYKPDWLRYI
ncbi:hypothetical protein P7C73_g2957, partial [Tremellales sp. Uapishka_1]